MRIITAIISGLLITQAALAEDLSGYTVVKLANGITSVDFSADGKDDMVVLGHRENYNAHGFEVATFYIKSSIFPSDPDEVWHIIPLGDGRGELQVTVGGGAECLLHDFRLLKGRQKNDVRLVVAKRELGESFADENTVTFSIYALRTNEEHLPGSATFYFEKISSSSPKKKYCDVGEALSQELGLKDYRPDQN